jgi:hypothetical protein
MALSAAGSLRMQATRPSHLGYLRCIDAGRWSEWQRRPAWRPYTDRAHRRGAGHAASMTGAGSRAPACRLRCGQHRGALNTWKCRPIATMPTNRPPSTTGSARWPYRSVCSNTKLCTLQEIADPAGALALGHQGSSVRASSSEPPRGDRYCAGHPSALKTATGSR